MRTVRMTGILAFCVLMAAAFSACRHEDPGFIYMPDMVYTPAFKPQRAPYRLPVQGTIPRGYVPYRYTSSEEAGKALINPLPPTKSVLARGQYLFNSYCIACHGPMGEGDGYVVPKFPRPPSLQSDKVRGWPDGSIFHVITRGQTVMPSYASQISVQDRWAIIHYVRALQRSKHPTPEDIKAAQAELGQ